MIVASAGDELLVVGFDLVAEVEVHVGDRPMEHWNEVGYSGNRTVVCMLCWFGIDAEAGTRVALVPRGRLGGRNRPHFAHPPGFAVHTSATARETMWHLTTKHRLARWAAGLPNVAEAVAERWTVDRRRRADVGVVLADGSALALEAQSRVVTDHAWRRRHRDYVANGICDVWFMASTAQVPFVLFDEGVQAFRMRGDAVEIMLGQGHARMGEWWKGDLDHFAQHYPPCDSDHLESMRFELDEVGLSSCGVTFPQALISSLASSRLRVERDARVEQHLAAERLATAQYQQAAQRLPARAAGANGRATSSRDRLQLAAIEAAGSVYSPRQRRIAEVRASIAARAAVVADATPSTAVEAAAEAADDLDSGVSSEGGTATAAPRAAASWVPRPAFIVDLPCVHCGAPMGVLTSWPPYMGVPRQVHPLQCSECHRLSGAACPCSDCTGS